MRAPLPTNRLVVLALAGAVLTGVVAAGLAAPSVVAGVTGAASDTASSSAVGPTAPAPNQNFTPNVSAAPAGGDAGHGHESDEHGGYEEHED